MSEKNDLILMIDLETAQQIVQEAIEAHLKIHPIVDDRIIDHIQQRMRARSIFAAPFGFHSHAKAD